MDGSAVTEGGVTPDGLTCGGPNIKPILLIFWDISGIYNTCFLPKVQPNSISRRGSIMGAYFDVHQPVEPYRAHTLLQSFTYDILYVLVDVTPRYRQFGCMEVG